jgi:hypothetical protein
VRLRLRHAFPMSGRGNRGTDHSPNRLLQLANSRSNALKCDMKWSRRTC